MRVIDIARSGSERGVLYPTHAPMPSPAEGEVLLRIAYAGVNRADVMQRDGLYMPPPGAPLIPGLEASGTIEVVGRGVIGWSVGEEVCALMNGGAYAEYAIVPATQLLSCPKRVSLAQAATLPEAAATAYMALAQEAQLKAGERVLIHGGASGVGLMLAQVARAWGAQVFATAGGDEKCQFVRTLGVTAIDHQAAPFAQQVMERTSHEGIDVIIDTLGGPLLTTHLKLLRQGGRIVHLALLEGAQADAVPLGRILMKHLSLRGATLRSRSLSEKAAIVQGVHQRIWPHLANGQIRPVIDSIYPLEEAEKAQLRMEERLHCGKILLEVAAN